MALLIATFLIVPVVNAAHCLVEADTMHLSAVEFVGEETTHQTDHSDVKGHCCHGHCHHATAHIPPEYKNTAHLRQPLYTWPDDAAVLVTTPDKLIRPPKA